MNWVASVPQVRLFVFSQQLVRPIRREKSRYVAVGHLYRVGLCVLVTSSLTVGTGDVGRPVVAGLVVGFVGARPARDCSACNRNKADMSLRATQSRSAKPVDVTSRFVARKHEAICEDRVCP